VQGLGSGAPGRGVRGAAGRVNWPRRKVAPEQRPTHPYVVPHTTKIHTPITLGICHRAKLPDFKPRRRRPCGFDSHRPLQFSRMAFMPDSDLRAARGILYRPQRLALLPVGSSTTYNLISSVTRSFDTRRTSYASHTGGSAYRPVPTVSTRLQPAFWRPHVHSRLIDSVDRHFGRVRSPWSPPSVIDV
jgi:hypothetical protein